MYSSIVMNRLYEYNPKIQLILLLRNPIQRAYSGFWEARLKVTDELLAELEAYYKDAEVKLGRLLGISDFRWKR